MVLCIVQNAPRENPDCSIDPREVELFRSYYSSLMYKVCCLSDMHGWALMHVCVMTTNLPQLRLHACRRVHAFFRCVHFVATSCARFLPPHLAVHPLCNPAQLCSNEAAAGQQAHHWHLLLGASLL